MANLFTAAQRRFILTEMGLCMALGTILPAATMYLTLNPFPMAIHGADGFGAFVLKNAFGMGTVMTLLMTLGVRGRVAKGAVEPLAWTPRGHPLLRLIPRFVILRALLFGLAALVVPGMIAFLAASGSGLVTIDRLPFAFAMAGDSLLIALSLSPLILVGAMSDRLRRADPEPHPTA